MNSERSTNNRRARRRTSRVSVLFLVIGAFLAAAANPADAFGSSYTISAGGPPLTVTTTAPDENATATFAGIGGARISLRMTDVTIGPSTCCSTKVSVLKPDGRALVSPTFVGTNGGFIDTKTLPTTGTYTILVDPQKTATGSMTLTLYDVPPDDVDPIVPGGMAVTVTAAVPGQNATLTFPGTSGQRVSLLVGPTCCSVQVAILKPNGSKLTSAFIGTAGGFIETQTLPQAGTYTISVDPQSFATGDVTLTLYDVPADVTGTISPAGPEVTVTTTVPGQNAKLTFPGAKDQRISLKVGPTCCVTRVSILDPFGNTVVSPSFIGTFGGFIDTKTLSATGTYTIVIDPQSAAVGSTTLTLYDVPADPTASIAPDGPAIIVTTTTPGQNAKLTFAGTTGQRVSLKIGPSCCALNVSILNPDGSTLVAPKSITTAGGFVDPVALPATGTYTIVVDPQGFATGSVTLTLHDVPADVTGTITPGGPEVAVTTTVPGQNAKLTFAGTSGQRISLAVGAACCATAISIVKPDGTTLIAPTFFGTFGGFLDTTTLPATGTYTIVVDVASFATGSVPLTLYDVPPDVARTIALGGAPVTVTVTTPGQNANLTFAGTAGESVSLEIRPTCCVAKVSIVNPDGTALVPPTFVGTSGTLIDAKTLPATGTYTIVADPQGAAIGDMTFSLYDIPPEVAGTITAGGPSVTVTTTTPGQNAAITFSGTVGQRVSLRVGTACCLTKVSIVSPDLSTLVSPTTFPTGGGFIDTKTLPTTGTYTIVIDPQDASTGDYTLTLYDVPPDAVGTATIEGPKVTVTTTTPGQNARVTFSGSALDGVKLTTGPFNCCHARISVLNPDGTTLVSPTAFNPDGGAIYTRLPVTGTYTIFVDLTGPNVGDVHLGLELDNTAPAVPVLSLSESSPDGHVVGATFYYRPAGSSSFTVAATTSDGDTGVQKIEFPGLSGGFTPTSVTSDGISPFAQTYSWLSGATYDYALNVVTAYDKVGNTSSAAFAVSRDADPPITTDNTAAIGSSWKNTSQVVALAPTDARSGVAATYYTTDGSAPTTASAQGTAVSLTAEGIYAVKYFSVDNVANVEDVKTAGDQIRIDKTKPSAATLDPLPSVIKTGQALTGSGSDALSGVGSISYYYCAGSNCTPSTLLGSSSTGPSYAVTWSSQPADGAYQVLARVIDAAGNSLDSAKRTVTIDNTAPNTTITKSPANPTNQTSATFEFTSSESGSTFECRFDGSAWVACTSPKSYTGLVAGTHTFEVRATDSVGNTDATPASFTWTIDLTPPDTTITSAPASATNQTSASFSFTSSESGSTFQCSLDGGAYASCTSPKSYTALSQGTHTFAVRAIDPAGNIDATAATYSWTIDTTLPDTTITAAPASPTNATSASFSFTSNESGSTFACSLDGAAFASCASATSYAGLAAGSHTFRVRAIDPVGNVDGTPAIHTWIIDLTAPQTTIGSAPANPTNQTSASVSFTSSESGSTFECQLDGGGFTACATPKTYTGLAAGSHTFDVRATDTAGNTDATPASFTWTIDLTAPDTTITSAPASATNQTSASFSFVSTESGSTFQCSIDGAAFASCTTPKSYTGLAAGTHTFEVRATDPAGNTDGAPATHTWTIDTTAPATTITSAPASPTKQTSASLEFSSSESGSTFECRLDGGAWAACTSATSYTGLPAGTHTFEVRATDTVGNTDATPATHTWIIDLTAPETTVSSAPANPTNQTSASFSFTSSESGSTFECSLDGAVFTTCTSPMSYAGLAAATHTFEVRATDPAGNTDATPAAYGWTIELDAPETTIGSGPANPTNQTSATFAFGSSETGSTFECRLDAGAWAACTSPKSYTGLAAGTHTFAVQATDPAGNADPTPATSTWTVDTAAPETTITAAPANPTNQPSASFSFTSNESGSSFECSLDGAAFSTCTSAKSYTGLSAGAHTFEVRATDTAANTDATAASHTWTIDLAAPETTITSGPVSPTNQTSASFSFTSSESGSTFECQLDGGGFTACATPKTYTGLAAATHTFEVRATDPAGNTDASPATRTWTVDAAAPETTITSAPPNATNATSASFEFESSETSSTFECRLDAGAWAACTSPASYTGLAAGSHTFDVRAIDAAGNTDVTPASHTWTIDLTAPETTITSSPGSPTNQTSATFTFSASETGSTFQCQVDVGGYAPCTSPATYTGLAAGSHTFHVKATDQAANVDTTPAIHTWTIDVTAPETTIASAPADPTNQTNATFGFSSSESGSTFECSLDGAAFTSCSSPKSYAGLSAATHTFEVRATDPAGNADATPAVHTWTIDVTAPGAPTIASPADGTVRSSRDFTVSGTAEAGSTVELFDWAASLGTATAGSSGAWSKALTGVAQGSHTYTAKATDPAGNTSGTSNSVAVTVDLTAPNTKIDAGPAGSTSSATATFAFSADDAAATFECSLDGASFTGCASPIFYSGLGEGSHTFQVRATDAVGNTDATPASRTWKVDVTAPAAPVITSPAAGSTNTTGNVTVAGTAEAGSIVEVFDGTTSKGVTVADSGGNWSKSLTSVPDGSHTYTATATDTASNTSPVSNSVTVTVDATAPQTTIETGPAATTNETSASFTFSASEIGSTFECRLDTGGWASCTSPHSYTALPAAPHTFEVRATDSVGNTDATPAIRSWTVDLVAPETTISSGPSGPTDETSATFEFASSETGSTFVCSLDGAAFAACTSVASYTGLSSGSHTFEVKATDAAGNTDSTAASRTWTVDTAAPETTISSAPSDPTVETTASFTFSSSDAGSTFDCQLDSGGWSSCTSPYSYTGLTAGSHTFDVRATDPAGNTDATPATHTWTVT